MFLINLQGKDSIYEQIREQIVRFIGLGVLNTGDRLPTVRGLAEDLGINPNTVMKAYQELEDKGYIYMLNKKGAFVSKDFGSRQKNADEIKKYIESFRKEGYSKEELIDIVNCVYERSNNA